MGVPGSWLFEEVQVLILDKVAQFPVKCRFKNWKIPSTSKDDLKKNKILEIGSNF